MTLRSSTNTPFVDNRTPTPDRCNAAYLNQIGDEVNPLTVKVATVEQNADVTDAANVTASLPTQTGHAGHVLGTDGAGVISWVAQTGSGSGMTDPLTTAGDIIVRGASATVRKAVGTTGQVLRVNTSNADKLEYATLVKADVGLSNVDNTTDATKPVSAAQASANAAVALASVPINTVDAKGDLIVGTGNDTVARLPVTGTTGDVLSIDPSTSTGLRWKTPGTAAPVSEVTHNFTKDANGAIPTLLDSGHSRVLSWNRVAATPTIVSGRFTMTDVAAGAGDSQISVALAGTCTHITADFDFSAAGTTDGQGAILTAWATAVPAGSAGPTPDGPCFLIFQNTYMDYSKWVGTTLINIGRYFYATPLGSGTNHVEVFIDKANSQSTVIAPDGAQVVFSDASIGSMTAAFAGLEIYSNNCDTDHRVNFQKFSASSLAAGTGTGLGPDTVGWTELIASGTPSATTFVKVDAAGNLSAAVPSTTGQPGANSVGWNELNKTGTPTASTYIKVDANGALSAGTPASSSTPAGTASNYANVVVDFGANPNGGSDAGPAFRAAAATGRTIYVPPGTYSYNGPGLTGSQLNIVGTGQYQTAILLPPGGYFVDNNQVMVSFRMEGIRFTGGAGHVRSTFTGGNVNNNKEIRDCVFLQFTNCSIQGNSTDSPDWKIINNIWNGANTSTTMCVALKGLTDNCDILGNEFQNSRVALKLDRGNNVHVHNNAFLRFSNPDSASIPRCDIHICNANLADNNRGAGGVFSNNKFGNENFAATDRKVVYADELAGTWFGDRFPNLASNASFRIDCHTYMNNLLVGNSNGVAEMIYSKTPQLKGFVIGPNMMAGIGFAPVLKLSTATGFDHTTHIVGPLVGDSINQNSVPALVVTESGTLSGQPRSL